MGLFGQIIGTIGENILKDKDQREREKASVQNNKGSKAICSYIADLFEKGNSGYDWVKKNRVGLFPVINKDSVSLCYTQTGDGKSFKTSMPKDAEVAKYSFQEMYSWHSLDANDGYSELDSRTQRNELESMINSKV